MLQTACYSRKRLKNYLSGKASEPDSDAIEQHVGRCTTCEHLLDELQSTDDSLERCLRIATPADQSQPPEWVRQLAAAPPPAADDPGADDAAEAVALQCLRSIDRYELLRTIGRGGMSIVYAARHRELQCDVALKILRPGIQADRAAQERFQREMQILGQLSHPAIVRATDAGRQDATRYLVMELVDGVDLSRLVRLVGPPSVAECCAMVAAAAEGLACAHAAGVIHRDIKPSNLLLAASGQIKIVDFGLARLGSTLDALTVQTTVGRLLGTLDYMAPEQVDGAADASSVDIYSLGATLYKLLTGRPPHGHSSEAPLLEYLRRVGANEIEPLSRYRADSPKALGDFVAELLLRDPAQRPHDAQHVAQRLQEFSAGADLKSLAREAISVRRDINAAAASADASPPSEAFFSSTGLTHEPPLAESESQLQSTGSGGRISFTTLVAGLSAFGLLAICGVLIVLQTNVGTLRIESEVDDVRVELVDEENAVQGVLVDQGEQETTLRAGRYRVRLAGSSDRLELKPDVVVLRRGETAVATVMFAEDEPRSADTAGPPREWQIQRESETASGEDSIAGKLSGLEAELEKTRRTLGSEHPTVQELQAEIRALSRQTPPQAVPTEPVYEGRTLPQWLAILQYEQKPQAQIQAAGAVRLLIPAVPPVAGFQAMFQAMLQMMSRRHPGVFDPVSHLNRVLERASSDVRKGQRERTGYEESDQYWKVFDEALQRLPAREQASMLATLIRSEDEEESKLAIVAVAINAQDLQQNPQIDIVDEALASVADDASSENISLAQLAIASLLPDPGAAAEILVSMNPPTQSNAILRLWWNLVRVRDLPVDRMERLKWAGHVLVAAPEMAEDVLFRNRARLFPEANWRDPGQERLNQLEAVLSPVIAEARSQLEASIEETNLPRSELSQLDQLVSILAKTARTIPVQRDPELAAEIVEILQQRLEQLVAFRETGLGDLSVSIPTVLADLTSTLLLQTGTLPRSFPELETHELLDIVEQHRVGVKRSPASPGVGYRVYGFDWYPFAAILAVQQLMHKTWIADDLDLLMKPLDPVIVATLLADASGLDAKQTSGLVRQLTIMNGVDELKRLIDLHPNFRLLIERWHERATDPESKAMAARILGLGTGAAAAEGDVGLE